MNGADTIFHKIIRKEIPAKLAYEDEQVVAFYDINPAAPTHILVVPKKSIATLNDLTAADETTVGHMVLVATKLAREKGISDDGYRLVINCGEHGGQTVFQLHLHLLGGREHSWPPG